MKLTQTGGDVLDKSWIKVAKLMHLKGWKRTFQLDHHRSRRSSLHFFGFELFSFITLCVCFVEAVWIPCFLSNPTWILCILDGRLNSETSDKVVRVCEAVWRKAHELTKNNSSVTYKCGFKVFSESCNSPLITQTLSPCAVKRLMLIIRRNVSAVSSWWLQIQPNPRHTGQHLLVF